jgi:ectoine hydroxylase-related dioxygenase (phytanoyl-CoA dioxygenase family)
MTQTPQFKIIPDNNELDQIERDLRFHTLGVENPSTLTREQIASFNRDGFLKGIHIFNESEIAAHRRYFDGLLERVVAAGGDSYSISTAHLKYSEVYDLLAHPRIVAVVKDLLGEDVIGWGSHYFCKMPRDGKRVSWHQDASYWPLTPSKTVTVWLAIDDADTENACMRFIPGSHLYGHLTWSLSEDDESNVLNQTIADAERFGAPVDDILRAGEISIHSDLTLHGSEANDSDRRRCGLTLRYCAADVRAYMGWNAKGVVVSGADPDGHWANAARPIPIEQR